MSGTVCHSAGFRDTLGQLASTVQGRVGLLMQVWSKSGTVLDSPSQLGTLLEDSGGPGALPRAVQVWTREGGFADGPIRVVPQAVALTLAPYLRANR